MTTCKRQYILGIETAARKGGVALAADGAIAVSLKVEQDQAHSQATAMLVQEALATVRIAPRDLRAVAVSIGPGSFTGVRIGLSLAKGICLASGKLLIGVSTLEALAARAIRAFSCDALASLPSHAGPTHPTGPTRLTSPTAPSCPTAPSAQAQSQFPFLLSPLLDARRGEIYAALFRMASCDGAGFPILERLKKDSRLHLDEWLAMLESPEFAQPPESVAPPILFTGDACADFRDPIAKRLGARAQFADFDHASPSAEAVALIACERLRRDPTCGDNWELLEPEYVHSHQAEPMRHSLGVT